MNAHPAPGDLRIEDVPAHGGFRPLGALGEGIVIDLRYTTANNFAGQVLYRGIDCAWLREEAAAGLEAAARWLAREAHGHRLVLLDALRPQRVQASIWRDVVGTPMQPYFADPAVGSIHSWGMAVDVSLIGPDGCELDMGSGFDEMSLASHPALHAEHLSSGVLKPEHVARRERLARAMHEGGFKGISTEWWHFDHGERAFVRSRLPRVW